MFLVLAKGSRRIW